MVLHHDVLLDGLDSGNNLSAAYGTADTSHILQADFLGACLNELLGQIYIVFYCVDGAVGDAERSLGNHAGFLCVLDGGDYVACVVQTAENTGDVCALGFLHLVEQLAEILGAGTHAQTVQCTVQHVGLNAGLVEGLGPFANALVGVFAIEQVHLFKTAAVGFNAVKASHSDDGGSHFYQLVYTGLVLARTLPHVAEYETEFYFSFHIFLLP